MAAMALYLFGPPRLLRGRVSVEISLRKALALFVYLAATKQAHTRDGLATLLWPEMGQREARAALRRTLHRLNQTLDEEMLVISSDTIALSPQANLWVDTEAFENIVTATLDQTPEQAISSAQLDNLVKAADLYRDDFLAGFTLLDSPAFDEWQFFEREHLRQRLGQVLIAVVEIYEAQAEYEQAIAYARRWLTLDPCHEPAHRQLMKLYAWSGQQAAALRQFAECERMLEHEFGAAPEAETRALAESIRLKRVAAPVASVAQKTPVPPPPKETINSTVVEPARVSAPRHNLPAQSTPFVPRDAILVEIVARLLNPACRLLTLTGPGGVGKTRLAIEAAHRLQRDASGCEDFANRVVFVDLAALHTADDLISAIGEALALSFYGDVAPRQQLLDHLATQHLLLVLDCFEHLMAGVALVPEILAAAPGVKILVTSREALSLAEEWFHPIQGMDFPQPNEQLTAPLHTFGAVRLFEQCAHRARLDFSLAHDQEHVLRICRLVDGMPLALELAAAWLKTVPTQAVGEEIARGIDILTAQHRNIPARHRSMRAVLEQSWAKLVEDERRTLMQLSFCRNGFRRDAAARIAGASLHILAALVDKSLVRTTTSGRYQMHELVRQFAVEALHATPKIEEETRRRHATYYLQFLHEREAALTGREAQKLTAEITEELENVRLAWTWAIANHEIALLVPAVKAFGYILWIGGRAQEAVELYTDALRQFEGQSTSAEQNQLHTQLIHHLHWFRALCFYFLGQYAEASEELQIYLASARRMGNQEDVASALGTLGTLAGFQGDLALARSQFEESLAIYEALQHKNGLADVQHELARISLYTGDYAAARKFALLSLANGRQIGRRDSIGYALITVGWANFCEGDYKAARADYDEGMANFEAIGHQLGISLALGGLGMVTWADGGDLAEAQALTERSLALCRQLGHRAQIAHRLSMLALIVSDRLDIDAAQQYAEEGIAIARAIGNPHYEMQNLCGLAMALGAAGNFVLARQHLLAALRLSIATELMPRIMLTLYCYAELAWQELEQQGGFAVAAPAAQQEILQLLRIVAQHPTFWAAFRKRAQTRLRTVDAEVLPSVRRAADEQSLDWHVAAQRLRSIADRED